ncbi:MAG: DUF2332 family protein [Pseudomonadota bacterium]
MTPALKAAFAFQAKACIGLGSPFMGRLLPLLPELITPSSALGERLADWPEDRLGPQHDSVPLRLAGALHHLHLQGAAPEITAVYPPHNVAEGELSAALKSALVAHEAAILRTLESPPQTNEVRRAAVLIAAGHWLTARFGKPLIVSEIGASAGLNLNWDFFCLEAAGRILGPQGSPVRLEPEWRGEAATLCPAYVAEAKGVDLRPIDVSDEAAALRLQSYLWPDQQDRLARTRAAIDVFLAPDTEAILEAGDAVAWLPTRLHHRAGHCHLIYSTIAWQYLPEAARAEGARMIAAHGALASDETPLAWLRMEPDNQSPGAGLTLDLWPGNQKISLGRADFHGRWVDWQAPAPV